MENLGATIKERVAAVRQNIAQAARRAGRKPEEVLLLAATKTRDVDTIREAIAAGVDAVGENRAQEFRDKTPELGGFPCHFIGRLQRNKLKYLVGQTPLIHSVDSLSLLGEIDKLAARRGLCQNVLLEINIGGEPSKGGVAPGEAPDWLRDAAKLCNIKVCGLMCIPPAAKTETLSYFFCEMRKLFVDIRNENMDNIIMDILSMGMSEDYALAVEHGSNLVRVGSAIFGERQNAGTICTEDEGL